MQEPSPLPIEIDCKATVAAVDGGEALLVDCRENSEWQIVHIDRAKLLPMSELGVRLVELEPHRRRRIIVHCHHGGRSLRVARWLREQGFAQAQSMAGGIDDWATQIDPSLARY